MTNKRRIILVAHCMFNEFSKVISTKNNDDVSPSNSLKLLMDNGIGIIQLPCPETYIYGLKRWGHVKEQFDHPFFKDTCKDMFDVTLRQIKQHLSVGDELVGLIGIAGSPSCGTHTTCSSDTWGGELGSAPNIIDTIASVKKISESGVFIEQIQEIFEEHEISLKMIEYNRNEAEQFQLNLLEFIKQE